MHKFYFNECLSLNAVSLNDFASLLANTIKEFDSLVKKDIKIDKGIILEKEKTVVCEVNLRNAIMSLPARDREIRTLAFAYFTKFPIQYHLQSTEIDEQLLEEQYFFEGIDATNLAIAKYYGCFLFSVAVDDHIKKNTLLIIGMRKKFSMDNLYGVEQNTQCIESLIRRINAASLSHFEQLKVELNNSIITPAFEKSFLSEPVEVQKSIIDMFVHAKERGLQTPYYPDTKIIKDVTPDNNRKKARVYELRVYYPKALRVYFFEYKDIVLIAKLEYKSSYKEENSSSQTKDIGKILTIIDNMIKTN